MNSGGKTPQGGGATILVADDDSLVRKLLKECLEMSGYTVFVAENGAEALRIFKENSGNIDLLISDVQMPVMNGRELAENIHRERPDLEVLFLSGYTADIMRERGMLDGDYHLITKPIIVSHFLKQVRSLIGQ